MILPPPHFRLPGKFGSVVRSAANSTQAPIELVSSIALAAAALAVQGHCTVRLKPGLESLLALMILIIGESGERKSPTQSIFFKAFYDMLSEMQALADQKSQDLAADHAVWEEKAEALRAELKQALRKGKPCEDIERKLHDIIKAEPKALKTRKLIYQDVTVDALLFGLKECGNSAAFVFDEFEQFLRGRMSNQKAVMNSMWSGGCVHVDRKTGSSFMLDYPRLTCLFQTQPTVLQDFLRTHGKQARGNGFMSRILPSFPFSTQGTRFEDGLDRPIQDLEWFYERCKTLVNRTEKRVLKFTPDAQQMWFDAVNMYERNCAPGGCNHDIRDFASKAGEHIARVAAVMHAFMVDDSDEISAEILQSAIDLVEWHRQQYQLLMAPNDPILEFQHDCQTLYAWVAQSIQKNGSGGIPWSFVLKYGPNRLRKESKMKHTLEALVSTGQILIFYIEKTKFVQFPPPPGYLSSPPLSLYR